MKSKVLFTIIAGVLTACSGSPESQQQNNTALPDSPVTAAAAVPVVTAAKYTSPALLQYEAYLNQLDTQQLITIQEAAQNWQKLFKQQPAAVSDTGLFLFDKYFNRVATWIETSDTTDFMPLVNYGETEKEKIPSYVNARLKLLEANGIIMEQEEGTPFLVRDMELLAKLAEGNVSPAMQQYFNQLHKEQQQGFQNDGGLTITPIVLADRVAWWDQFSKANPHFLYADKALENYHFQLHFLLAGMENTRSAEDGKLADDFKKAYYHLIEKYKGTETESFTTPYLRAYEENNPAKAEKWLNECLEKIGRM